MGGCHMNTSFQLEGFRPIMDAESVAVFGGVDKKAQDALYTIGYVIGLVARFIVTIFSFGGKQVDPSIS